MVTLQDYLNIETKIVSFIHNRYPFTMEKEDLQQELRIKVWQNLDNINPETLSGWAITTGFNIVVSHNRKKEANKRLKVGTVTNLYNPIGTTISRLTMEERQVLVTEMLAHVNRLPEGQRRSILYWLDGNNKLGVTQKTQVNRATHALRKRMKVCFRKVAA